MELSFGVKLAAALNGLAVMVFWGFALLRPPGPPSGVIPGNFANVLAGVAGAVTAAFGLLAGGLLYFTRSGGVVPGYAQVSAQILFVLPLVLVGWGLLLVFRG